MNDKDYISGFRHNNEAVIASFYKEYRTQFIQYFKTRYGKSEEYVTDLYQESCIILWQNIRDSKLTEDNLTSSLSTYLLSIGRYTMMAGDRKYKEILDDDSIRRLRFVEDNEEELRNRIEREEFVDRVVNSLQSPCAELLQAFYWNKLTGQQIADKLGYSNADSVKTQKHKCMGKLKALIAKFPRV